MLKIVVLVSGGGTNLQAIIDAISNKTINNVEIAAVISNKKDAFALKRAENNGIPSYYISKKEFSDVNEYDNTLIDTIKKSGAELVVLAGFLVVLSEKFVKEFEGRIINIHPSLIPSFCGKGYYGLRVHEEALKRGVKVTGATVHFVDGGTDTGPIIYQKAVEILDGDTPEILQKRVMEQAEWIILPNAINAIAAGEITIVNGRVISKK